MSSTASTEILEKPLSRRPSGSDESGQLGPQELDVTGSTAQNPPVYTSEDQESVKAEDGDVAPVIMNNVDAVDERKEDSNDTDTVNASDVAVENKESTKPESHDEEPVVVPEQQHSEQLNEQHDEKKPLTPEHYPVVEQEENHVVVEAEKKESHKSSDNNQLKYRSKNMGHYLADSSTSSSDPQRIMSQPGTGAFVGGKPFLTNHKYVPGTAAGLDVDEDEDAVREFIEVLQRYIRDCEKQRKYIEAEIGQKRLRELREGELSRKLQFLREQHVTEQVELQGAYASEMAAFDESWTLRLQNFENEVRDNALSLQQRHETELSQLKSNLTLRLENRPRFSRQLFELRKVEDSLAKSKDFLGAQRIRVMADRMEDEERENMRGDNTDKLMLSEQRMLHQHKAEAQAMRQRVDANRDNLLRKRQTDLGRYVQRFQNILASLSQKQRNDTAKLLQTSKAVKLRDEFIDEQRERSKQAAFKRMNMSRDTNHQYNNSSSSSNDTRFPVVKYDRRPSTIKTVDYDMGTGYMRSSSSSSSSSNGSGNNNSIQQQKQHPLEQIEYHEGDQKTQYQGSFNHSSKGSRPVPLAAAAYSLEGPDHHNTAYNNSNNNNYTINTLPPVSRQSSGHASGQTSTHSNRPSATQDHLNGDHQRSHTANNGTRPLLKSRSIPTSHTQRTRRMTSSSQKTSGGGKLKTAYAPFGSPNRKQQQQGKGSPEQKTKKNAAPSVGHLRPETPV